MAAQAPAFAILQPIAGDRPAYPVRKLSVSLGKGDKRGVDLHLGDCGDIARIHAIVQFNFGLRRFELSAVGKTGVIVNGLIFAVGCAPVPLESGDLIQVPCTSGCAPAHEMYFLLARSSADRGRVQGGLHVLSSPWSVQERDRFQRALLDVGHMRPVAIRERAELVRRTVEEIVEFTGAFVSALHQHCPPGALRRYLESVAPSSAKVPEAISGWRLLRKQAGQWARRIRALHLLQEVVFLRDQVGYDVLLESDLPPLVPGWAPDDDRALLLGAHRHGWTQISAIKSDESLPFSKELEWPPSDDVIMARLDRLLNEGASGDGPGRVPITNGSALGTLKRPEKRRLVEDRAQLFTKRQRIDFMRALMIYGVCRDPVTGQMDWSNVRRRDGLRHKRNSTLIKVFQSFCEESARMAPGVLPVPGPPPPPRRPSSTEEPMTHVVAKKFRKRLSLMNQLRTRVLVNPDLESLIMREPPPSASNLPSWWSPACDHSLLLGVGIEGIGQWSEMFDNQSLSWPPEAIQGDPPKSEPLFSRVRQLVTIYAPYGPREAVGPFDTIPSDFGDEEDEQHAPQKIRINRASMQVVK
ncbi:unnamed protein product (mitochondrion) [Plasmodiophora brassicae]|uniref:FHA domain-containing protein n=1 Tax=Plasmodiophora brassicae TaxID=37360 RepID=A0A0G4ISM8_PLABS|nr:hypothetical protein PBRA_006210 [Plasmodiophora brassicae]SPQ96085.1 unnamed protein product [Plasmodiophora brassicae]